MFYDRFTRFLHLFLALGVIAQLALSEWMHHPRPTRAGDNLYEFHEYIGLSLMVILILHWLWSFVRPGRVPLSQLFPWFSRVRMADLITDVKLYLSHLIRLKLPGTKEPSPLAGAIQGAGLVVATGMAVSGTVIYFAVPETWVIEGWVRRVFQIHELLANLMWAYLILHAAAAITHQLFGHEGLFPMLAFWRRMD